MAGTSVKRVGAADWYGVQGASATSRVGKWKFCYAMINFAIRDRYYSIMNTHTTLLLL